MSKNWAICIGVNGYKHGVGKLKYARRDALEMGKFFKNELKFEEVFYFAEGSPDDELEGHLLIQDEPTIGSLDQFLQAKFETRNFLSPHDNLWFFFAGHGMRSDGIDYLLPIDGNPKRIEKTGLQIHYVAERLRRCGAGNIVLMLDACRNGDSSRDIGISGIGIEAQQGVITFFSCDANEPAYEIAALEHGAFTCALLEGLRPGGNNCAIVDRLGNYVKHRVRELNQIHNQRNDQTPQVRAEPADKLYSILLPAQAGVDDTKSLRNSALRAERDGNLDKARELWIRVLAVIQVDLEAIQGLEGIAARQEKERLTEEPPIDPDPIPPPPPPSSFGRRQAIQTLVAAGGGLLLGKATSQAASPDQTAFPIPEVTFNSLTVNTKGEMTRKKTYTSQIFRETIGGISLDLIPIPRRTFAMGSPNGEGEDDEHPQHRVNVAPFLMGRYPVTQAQWRTVTALPKVKQDLKPAPSRFKGDGLPVEQVSWDDAVEFCQRLSKHTSRGYRLPSEAEWEYACRAKTTSPFHFGATLTADLANYDANYTYGDGPKGQYREQTTNVGSFSANAFGLYDMHGNVWEWCQDHWHENYAGAPTDGSVWLSADENAARLLRGGSWGSFPGYCRSADRIRLARYGRDSTVGFRVVCASSWTL